MAILDWSIGPTYIMKLLQCQHEQKPSVQQLVKVVTQDFFIRLAEPSVSRVIPCAEITTTTVEADCRCRPSS